MGGNSIAVLLSGMGNDGADAMKMLRDKGAFTLAQDEASCVAYGLPGEAVLLDAVCRSGTPQEIAAQLARSSSRKH